MCIGTVCDTAIPPGPGIYRVARLLRQVSSMRVSTFFSLFAATTVLVAISACTGAIQVSPTCDGGACTSGGDGGTQEGGGTGKEGDACYTSADCALPTQCLFQAPGEETPAAACGSQGVCRTPQPLGVPCSAPPTYMGCDCAGLSVSSCQQLSGYLLTPLSVVFNTPTTTHACPNDAPFTPDAGPKKDASGDLNVTGSLTVDSQKCSLTASSRQTQSAPDGHTWTLSVEATCPTLALGHVTLFVTGTDTVIYPYGCATANMQLSVGGEGDAGFLAYDGQSVGGSCNVNDGPTASDEPNKVRGTGTLSNGAGKSHSVDIFEP